MWVEVSYQFCTELSICSRGKQLLIDTQTRSSNRSGQRLRGGNDSFCKSCPRVSAIGRLVRLSKYSYLNELPEGMSCQGSSWILRCLNIGQQSQEIVCPFADFWEIWKACLMAWKRTLLQDIWRMVVKEEKSKGNEGDTRRNAGGRKGCQNLFVL